MKAYLRSIVRHIKVRPRLSSSVVFGCIVVTLLPTHFSGVTRALLSWDAGVVLYLILAVIMFVGATPAHMRARAMSQDDGALVVLLFVIIAASATIVAIIIELSGVKSYAPSLRLFHFGLGIGTLISSWLFIHTSFALHYAHEYYICRRQHTKLPLVFPEQSEPDYWDFLYFSFVIGMTSQTSDVAIAATNMRRLAVLHGIIAFFFNAALLALAINAAASTL
jgi:uncharacterized membrane protein